MLFSFLLWCSCEVDTNCGDGVCHCDISHCELPMVILDTVLNKYCLFFSSLFVFSLLLPLVFPFSNAVPFVVCLSCHIPNFIESPLCPRSAPNSSPAHGPKAPVRSRSIDRLKTVTASSSDTVSLEHAQVGGSYMCTGIVDSAL